MHKNSTFLVALSFAIVFIVVEVFAASILRVFNDNNYKFERALLSDITFEHCVLVFIESTDVSFKGITCVPDLTDEIRTGNIQRPVQISFDEMDELVRIVWCESGLEPFEGMCLVVDTVLNRVDDPRFPGNIHDVLYAPGQYSTVHTRKFKTCTPSDDCYSAIEHELVNRTNTEVLYFGRTPITHNNVINVGHHYFSN